MLNIKDERLLVVRRIKQLIFKLLSHPGNYDVVRITHGAYTLYILVK